MPQYRRTPPSRRSRAPYRGRKRTDRSDGEVILFYEYQQGTVELQFEFGAGRALSFITLAMHGVLSTEEQRKAYGVTKPWP